MPVRRQERGDHGESTDGRDFACIERLDTDCTAACYLRQIQRGRCQLTVSGTIIITHQLVRYSRRYVIVLSASNLVAAGWPQQQGLGVAIRWNLDFSWAGWCRAALAWLVPSGCRWRRWIGSVRRGAWRSPGRGDSTGSRRRGRWAGARACSARPGRRF